MIMGIMRKKRAIMDGDWVAMPPRNRTPMVTKVKTLQTLEATPNFAALFRSGELGSGMEVFSFGSGLGGLLEKASGF